MHNSRRGFPPKGGTISPKIFAFRSRNLPGGLWASPPTHVPDICKNYRDRRMQQSLNANLQPLIGERGGKEGFVFPEELRQLR